MLHAAGCGCAAQEMIKAVIIPATSSNAFRNTADGFLLLDKLGLDQIEGADSCAQWIAKPVAINRRGNK